MKNNLTSRERVLRAFHHEEPDRVPIHYLYNPGIHLRLKQHFGLAEDDEEGSLCRLGVDFRGIYPAYSGPRLHAEIPGLIVDPAWEHETSGSPTNPAAIGIIVIFPSKMPRKKSLRNGRSRSPVCASEPRVPPSQLLKPAGGKQNPALKGKIPAKVPVPKIQHPFFTLVFTISDALIATPLYNFP